MHRCKPIHIDIGMNIYWKYFIFSCLCAVCLLFASIMPAWSEDKVIEFNIPSSRADKALNLFARQADMQILYPYETIKRVKLSELLGQYSVEEGMRFLLRGSCLKAVFEENDKDPLGNSKNSKGTVIMKVNDCKKIGMISALSATFAAVMTPVEATAQENPQARSRVLEEIVVVARRTEESLQSVPISVTAIDGQQLRAANIDSGSDLQRLVPTLNVQQNSLAAGHAYSLRGVRTGVITYFNEVPTETSAVDLQLWDLSSVQALSGPQGTLFGRNSTGGAILFVPQSPTDNLSFEARARLGNYNERQYEGILNVPINDSLKLRIGARNENRDGVVDNELGKDFQSQYRKIFRVSSLFEPVNWLNNYTIFDYSKRDEQPFPNITTGLVVQPCPVGLLSCLFGQTLLENELGMLDTRKVRHPHIQGLEDKRRGVTNNLTLDFGSLKAKYIFGYRKGESFHAKAGTSLPIPFIIGFNETMYDKRTTHEIQLLGDAFEESIDWVVGAFISRSEYSTLAARVLFGAPGSTFDINNSYQSGGKVEEDSDAFYGQLTWKIGELRLTGGLRRTEDDQSSSQLSFSPNVICNLPDIPSVDLDACRRTLSDTFSATTYNISVDYQVSDDLMLYATHRRGYNTGGFNVGIPDAELVSYEPEYIKDYEIGLKSEWLLWDMPIRTNISSFYAKYEDIQRTTNVVRNNLSYVGQFNAAEATMYGLQSELLMNPSDNFTISVAYGYLHTKYDSFDNAFIGNATGNKFAQAPENTLNIAFSYAHDMSLGGSVLANLSYTYQDEITFVDANLNAPAAFQDGYGLVNFRVDWINIANSAFDVGFYLKNATDKEYALNILDQTNTFGFVSTVFADPRTYGLEVRYSWQE